MHAIYANYIVRLSIGTWPGLTINHVVDLPYLTDKSPKANF